MRVTSQPDTLCRSLVKGAAQYARAIEKCSPASALHQERPQTSQDHSKPTPRTQVEAVSQTGTDSFDPNWDGPRLLPTFVAQLLGQVMPERRASVALETAYGTARLGRMALLVDRKS
jgi:hypothetical protein